MIDKVSFKSNSMSLDLVLLEKQMFTQKQTRMLQRDAIMSVDKLADIIISNYDQVTLYIFISEIHISKEKIENLNNVTRTS